MKRIGLILVLMFVRAAYGGAWPTDTVNTTHMDAGTDDPGAARGDIKNVMDLVSSIIGARNSASGVAPLDSSALVPLANIPTALPITGGTISSSTINNSSIGGTTPSDGSFTTGAFSGAVTSTKSCYSGYTRIAPNYCSRDGWSLVSMTSGGTTQAVAAPTGALYIDLAIEADIYSLNAVGERGVSVDIVDSSGTTRFDECHALSYEYVAHTTTQIGVQTCHVRAKVESGYWHYQVSTTGSGASYSEKGYWD